MIRNFALVLRLVRGGGAGGLLRLALMTLGFALGVVIVIFLAMMPEVLDERGRVTAARQPIHAEESGTFRVSSNFGSWRGVRFTRVLVASPGPSTPLPIGVTQLPRPGEVVLSPAAATLAQQDSDFAALVGGKVVGDIDRTGLLGPDELFAYIGAEADDVPGASEARGWGGYHSDESVRSQFSDVPIQLLLIVAAPALIYFSVCARLSAASRSRRYAALRLVGMDRRRLVRIAAMESAVPGLVGAALGLLAYQVLNQLIGPSGVVGFTWYPEDSSLSTPVAVAVLVLLVAASAIFGGVNTGRALRKPVEARFDPADRPPRWWYAAPFVFGLGLIAYPLTARPSAPSGPMDTVTGSLLLVGIVLSAVGLLLALRPGLVVAARSLARSGVTISVRLAARRVEFESSGLARHLAGLSALVLIASVGAAVLRQAELSATPAAERLTVKINAQDVPADKYSAISALPAHGFWSLQKSVTTPPSVGVAPSTVEDFIRMQGVDLIVANCTTLRRNAGRPMPDCRDGASYRVQPATAQADAVLPVGLPITFRNSSEKEIVVRTPEQTIDLTGSPGMPRDMAILVTGPTSPVGLTGEAFIFYHLLPDVVSMELFASRLASIAPAATMNVFDLDLGALEAFRVHRGVVGLGVLLAFALGLAAFLISALGRALERRRQVTTLIVVGAPRRTLRAVQWYQTLGPLMLALILAVLVGHLAGNGLLQLRGQQSGWYTGTLEAALPMVGISMAAAFLVGFVVVGLHPRSEDLRRE